MKKHIVTLLSILIILAVSGTYFSYHMQMTTIQHKHFIRKAFAEVIESMNVSDETYAHYFAKNYVQQVNGKVLNYSQFIAHMKLQKSVMKSVSVSFKEIIVEGNKIATIHYVKGIKKDGGLIEAQVNAFFQLKDNKIVACNELTKLIKGDQADSDLGSRY